MSEHISFHINTGNQVHLGVSDSIAEPYMRVVGKCLRLSAACREQGNILCGVRLEPEPQHDFGHSAWFWH